MKIKKLLVALLTLCLTFTSFVACDTTDSAENMPPANEECTHKFNNGYCVYCREMDPSCQVLTAYNLTDYLTIEYIIANVDGTTSDKYVAFPYIFLYTSSKSSRVTFYDVYVTLEITVQQYIYDAYKYEECTVTVEIPVSLFGEGKADKGLDREDYAPVVLSKSYISNYRITEVRGCVSVQ